MALSADRPDEITGSRGAEVHLRSLVDQLRPGERIPAERDLAVRWGIARMTLRKAIDRLVSDGLLVRRPGSGTFVARKPIVRTLGLTSFSEDMRVRGLRPSTRLVAFERLVPDAVRAASLALDAGEEVVYFRRVRLADDEPIAVEETWIRARLVPGFGSADVDGSLYDVLEHRFGLRPTLADSSIAATVGSEQDARELGMLSGDACLRISMLDRAADGSAIMIAECRYRADRYELFAQLSHGGRA